MANKKMQRALVPRNRVEQKMNEGWVPVQGVGADGYHWEQGDLLMEMPQEKYDEICKQRSLPNRRLYEAIRKGSPVADVPEGMTATVSSTVQKAK